MSAQLWALKAPVTQFYNSIVPDIGAGFIYSAIEQLYVDPGWGKSWR